MHTVRLLLQVINVLHDVFTNIFDGLETRHASELAAIRAQYPSERPKWTEKPVSHSSTRAHSHAMHMPTITLLLHWQCH